MLELGGVCRVKSAEHHGLHGLEAGQGGVRRAAVLGYGVADIAIRHLFDAGDDIAHLARAEGFHGEFFRREDADLLHRLRCAIRHHADFQALF